MAELTMTIDDWGYAELKEYLMSLNGILKVDVKNEEPLEIYIKYDRNFINVKMIEFEIAMFLDVKSLSILSFDKHPTCKTLKYKIVKKDICCEYCFKSEIGDLFEIEGIEKVDSNFNKDNYYINQHEKNKDIVINIRYNPNIITMDEMRQIELKLNS